MKIILGQIEKKIPMIDVEVSIYDANLKTI